jgi:hypothetical protein
MTYVTSTGEVQTSRSPYRLSIIVEFFWTIINMIGLFLSTIFGDARQKVSGGNSRQQSSSRPFRPSGGPGGGPPRRNIRGMADLNRGAGCVPGGS